MAKEWFFISVSRTTSVAVPLESVRRLLAPSDADFQAYKSHSLSLASFLGVEEDPSGPGAIVLLASGLILLGGNASTADPGSRPAFLPLPDDLFERRPPWCSGLLLGGPYPGGTFVVSEETLTRGLA